MRLSQVRRTDMATLAELDALVDANPDAFAGIATAYEVLLGGAPSIDGFVFLINNARATNFGSNNPAVTFNQENIFINLTNALVQGNPAALAKFQEITQGSATLADKLGDIYDAYVPASKQSEAGRAFFARAEAQAFYTNVAAERGVAGADGAAIVGLAALLKILVTEDMGLGDAANDLRAAINDGSAQLPTDGAVFTPIETADGVNFDDDDDQGGIRLTAGTDIVSGNLFHAPRGFTPGGTDQVNTLNDDDVLTGTGTNPTLNVTFVDDADTGDQEIVPTLTGIETINADVRASKTMRLDLQDSTGIRNINVFGLDDNAAFTADNIQDAGGPAGLNLSINDTGADDAVVAFLYDAEAVAGAADVANLTLNDADLWFVVVDDDNQTSGLGVENLNLISKGGANRIELFWLEDVEAIKITGDSKLTLGDGNGITRAGTDQVESFRQGPVFILANGSLASVDASGLQAGMEINLGHEVTANKDGTSGAKVDFNIVGTGYDDVIRLQAGPDTNDDKIAGGAGNDRLQISESITKGTITDVETLDIRSQDGVSIDVDASLFTGLKTIMMRNESNDAINSTAGNTAYNLKNLTADQAANLVLQHSSTGSNAVFQNRLEPQLANDTASDLVGVTITDQADGEDRGINADPRFNFILNAGKIESLRFTDVDTESNNVAIALIADVTGTITVLGENQAGNFFNLSTSPLSGNAFQLDQFGGDADGKSFRDFGSGTIPRFSGEKVDASAYTGDLMVRVSNNAAIANGGQTVLGGKGNDHVIFDALNNTTAGLTISDTVKGGEGDDTLYLDGDGKILTIGQSEWTNVSGFETIHLLGNQTVGTNQDTAGGANDAYGRNSYNLTLTDSLIAANGEAVAGGRVIHIVNDNDPLNGLGVADDPTASKNQGVTIDARSLSASSNFTYDGEEGADETADRFILSDANVNGLAVIDGGAVLGAGNTATNARNGDILEVRNQSNVTLGDLEGISNIDILYFTNDLAIAQTHVLQLDNETVDRLVNNTQSASSAATTEILLAVAFDNANVAGAYSIFNVDASLVTNPFLNLVLGGGGGNDTIIAGAGSDLVLAGLGNDRITGGGGNDGLNGGGGNDVFIVNAGDTGITSATADVVLDFTSGIDDLEFGGPASTVLNSNENVFTVADFGAALTAANAALGGAIIYSVQQSMADASVFVFFDRNGDGNADETVRLAGVTLAGFDAPQDII